MSLFFHIGDEFATFSREQLSRHCPDRSGIEAYWHARKRVAGGFSSFARGWRFDIGLVTFSADRQVLNSANWAAECNKRTRIDLLFSLFFFPSYSPYPHSWEPSMPRVTNDDEHAVERDERLMRKGVWICRWINLIYEVKDGQRRAIYFLLL